VVKIWRLIPGARTTLDPKRPLFGRDGNDSVGWGATIRSAAMLAAVR
jgi:hypothetical protein